MAGNITDDTPLSRRRDQPLSSGSRCRACLLAMHPASSHLPTRPPEQLPAWLGRGFSWGFRPPKLRGQAIRLKFENGAGCWHVGASVAAVLNKPDIERESMAEIIGFSRPMPLFALKASNRKKTVWIATKQNGIKQFLPNLANFLTQPGDVRGRSRTFAEHPPDVRGRSRTFADVRGTPPRCSQTFPDVRGRSRTFAERPPPCSRTFADVRGDCVF